MFSTSQNSLECFHWYGVGWSALPSCGWWAPPTWSSTSSTHTTVTVRCVGVWPAVYGGPRGREVLSSSLRHEDHNCNHHGGHEDQSSNGDANREAPLGDAEGVWIINTLKCKRWLKLPQTPIRNSSFGLQIYILTTSGWSKLSANSSSSRSCASLTYRPEYTLMVSSLSTRS